MDIEGFVRGRLTKGEDEEELKSILAERIKETLGGEIITGKDYLRMAKSESEAVSLFREKKSRPQWSLTILKMSS